MTGEGPLRLRRYQLDAVDRMRETYAAGRRSPLLQQATGTGKTVIIAEVARGALRKGRRALFLVHRRELIRQTSAKLHWAGVGHGIIAPGFTGDAAALVQLGSVPTVLRRLASLPRFDLLVIDECHHVRARTWSAVLEAQPGARLLGVTATPARLDGKGLGIDAGGPFDAIVCGPPMSELIEAGWLSPVRVFAPQQGIDLAGIRTRAGDYVATELAERVDCAEIAGQAVDEYRRRSDHRPAIAFCATIVHAEHVAAAFRTEGYRSACVHGGLPRTLRDRLIAGLANGEIEVLTSCELISEGLDAPVVGAVILLRPTKSMTVYLQQVGRGMRPALGKEALVVLDHASNALRFGLPDLERVWTLDGAERDEDAEAPAKRCPECGAVNPIGAAECRECGHQFEQLVRQRPPAAAYTPDDLRELKRAAAIVAMPYRLVVACRLSEAELRLYADFHGYKPGWVWHRLREQDRARAGGSG
jgi:DNA repair protein RadD